MFGIHVISVIYLFLNNIVLSNADKVEFDWKVNSSFGQHILANSSPADKSQRHLEDNMFSDYDNIVNYSIKYLGCYRWFEWNDEARDDEDLRLSAKRVVSYRLCPSGSCSDSSEKGDIESIADICFSWIAASICSFLNFRTKESF